MKRFLVDKKNSAKQKIRSAKHNWHGIFASLYLRESAVVVLLFLIISISLATIYLKQLGIYFNQSPVSGGTYTEGIVGQPQSLNPLYSQGSSVDRSIVSLVYSGLVKIDKHGEIKPDLAESWDISEDKTKYTIHLKKNAFWHDGDQVLSEDILFTYSVTQDPDYTGPLKDQFKDVSIEAPDDFTIIFIDTKKDINFINKLTLGILPQHRWATSLVSDIPYLEQNLTPIGSGIFSFKNASTDESGKIINITLERNNRFYSDKPYIESIILKFYQNDQEIKNALTKKEIDGSADIDSTSYRDLENINRLRFYSYPESGYKAIFFNQDKSQLLANKEIRKIFYLSINKAAIENELYKKAKISHDAFNDYREPLDQNKNIEEAKIILSTLQAKDDNNDGILELNGGKITFALSINSDEESKTVAKIIKENLKQLGIEILVEEKNSTEFERDVLSPRNYQLVLLGQNYGANKNLYPFWHSTQLKSPGLNFSQVTSKRIDVLLENYLVKTDSEEKQKILETINKIILEENYAVFLYKPIYVYATDKKIKGLTKNYFTFPENRFIEIEKWYINSKWSFRFN
ncbi:peptide ABC transporter substrate-binding protein [bacterium]|nr:peptide ABC transporter substrate-binding protein [bacterium]